MSAPTPRRLVIEPLPRGSRRISLRCSCARVGRVAQPWEADTEVIEELHARHAQVAPRCLHRSPAQLRLDMTATSEQPDRGTLDPSGLSCRGPRWGTASQVGRSRPERVTR